MLRGWHWEIWQGQAWEQSPTESIQWLGVTGGNNPPDTPSFCPLPSSTQNEDTVVEQRQLYCHQHIESVERQRPTLVERFGAL
ncbi:MAG TPA: hypothetical protein V6D14_01615 [Coleofasciculaceae cyanobacterium]|jgi:hypothetical protein